MSDESPFLTRAELAARWKMPPKSLAQWKCNGTGPKCARIGKQVLYRLTDVIDWENEQFGEIQ